MPAFHKIKRYEDPELDRQIEELLRNLSPLQGSGAPTIEPRFLGDQYEDVDSGIVYTANGLAVSDWHTQGADPNKEDKSNKVTVLSGASTDTQYPSAKLVYDQLNGKIGDAPNDGKFYVRRNGAWEELVIV